VFQLTKEMSFTLWDLMWSVVIKKIKQSLSRPGVAQRVPES
jgi:hypothetical protein